MSAVPELSPRVSTGIVGLDTILEGGLLHSSVYLLTGVPGSGKTILAHQICFHRIAKGERVVYVTLLAETHAHFFANLQPLSFFSQAPIGEQLHYFSAATMLKDKGISELLDVLHKTIRQYNPSVLVFDTLTLAHAIAGLDFDLRYFLNRLNAYIEMSGCIVLLVTNPEDYTTTHSRNTMVDGVIELSIHNIEQRTARYLQVHKMSGSGFLEGKHTLQITHHGLTIYPRTDAIYATRLVVPEQRVRMKTGIPQLDDMAQGGILSNSTTMILGVPGSGKTFLGLHFLLAGCQNAEPGLYFGFYETPERLMTKADGVGLALSSAIAQHEIEVMWQPPLKDIIDVLAERLIQTVRQRGVKRLFIDGLAGFQQAAFTEGFDRFFTALMNELRALGVTTLFACEMSKLFGPIVEIPAASAAIVADNIISLRYVELHSQLYRLISILKMRESAYDTAIREFKITQRGIEVASTFQSAQAILTGSALPVVASTSPTETP